MTLKRAPMTPAAWEILRCHGDVSPALTHERLAGEVEAGRLGLFSGEIDGVQRLVILWRTEDLIDGGRELCIVAAAFGRGVSAYTGNVMAALEREAAGLGYQSTLVRTSDRGMAKKVALLGYRFCESVFRKELAPDVL